MTRKPLEEVDFIGHNGRWGRMIVVKGGKVLSGRITDVISSPDIFSPGFAMVPFASLVNLASAGMSAVLSGGFGKTTFRIGYNGICLETFGGDVEVVARFDILERFRTDNKASYFVQLKPRPEKPYEIRMDISRNVKGYTDEKGEKHAGVNDNGHCFRVYGHDTRNSAGGKAGILIHEASHPGWLIGCIAPREVNNKIASYNFTPSKNAMKTLFQLMGGFSEGKKADLLVMDW